MNTYYTAPQEIITMAYKLIANESDLSDIKDFVPIVKFLFDDRKEDAAKQSECKKLSGLTKHFAKCDFIILISQSLYDVTNLGAMEMVLHHELRHIAVKRDKKDVVVQNSLGEYEFTIRPHDVEAFRGIDEGVVD